MSNKGKFAADKEAILLALDQLSQTMEVMGQVVTRLKGSIEQAQLSQVSQTGSDHSEPGHTSRPVIEQIPAKPKQSNNEEKTFSSENVRAQSFVLH